MKKYLNKYIVEPLANYLAKGFVEKIKAKVKRKPRIEALITKEDLAEMFLDWKKQKSEDVQSSGAIDFLHYLYEELNLARVDKTEQDDIEVV